MFVYRKAVLIIHGFAGGTYDEEPLFFHLQTKLEFDVYNFTLPGHITNLSSDVTYNDWIKAVDDKINYLKKAGYKSIYIIGHSMGGVLATHAAIKHVEVKKLVLVAPAFQYLSNDMENILTKTLKNGFDVIKQYKMKEVIGRALKVSLEQVKEFAKLVEVSQSNPSMLTVPTLIVQGLDDTIVPHESSSKIYQAMTCPKWLLQITGVTHDVFRGRLVSKINTEISLFLQKKKYRAEHERKW